MADETVSPRPAAVHRRVTYKLYPSATQAAEMERVRELHRQLYNAALQERVEAWRRAGVSISYVDQTRSLTQIRREDVFYRALNAQSLQATLKRLDRAFSAFFRRVKAGGTPGFPRFKSSARFPGWSMNSQSGWRFTPGSGWRHGRLKLAGIGAMRARGEARTPGRVVVCDISRKAGGWFLSLVVECEPHRERTGDKTAGLDWGVETLATLCYGPHDFAEVSNDRLLAQEQEAIAAAQRGFRSALRGKRSKRAEKCRRHMARLHRKVANRRKDRAHKLSADLVAGHALIVTEALNLKNMTRSAKGTVEKPGKNVQQKSSLNRVVLDTAPGSLLSMLRYKAEEAGSRIVFANPRVHKPSQTDPVSGDIRKKALNRRVHTLPDGRKIGRDQAAAWVLWNIGRVIIGRVPAGAETPGANIVGSS